MDDLPNGFMLDLHVELKKTCYNCKHFEVYEDDYPGIYYCPRTQRNPRRDDKPIDSYYCNWEQNTKRG